MFIVCFIMQNVADIKKLKSAGICTIKVSFLCRAFFYNQVQITHLNLGNSNDHSQETLQHQGNIGGKSRQD